MVPIYKKLTGQNSIKSATVILIITLFLSNVLGVIRDHYLAQKIPTAMLDIYYAAFRIPDLIFNILILGAITASFIPIFSIFLTKNKLKEAWRIANSFLNIAVLGILVSTIILYFLMPYLIPLLVPKFDIDKQALTTSLSRLLLLSPIFFTFSYTFGSILNSFKRFFIYSLAPLVYNISIILATICWSSSYGIYGITYGVLIGSFLHMLIQLFPLSKIGYHYQFVMDYSNVYVRKIFILMIPRAIGLGANQIMLFIYTAIASSLTAGSIAIFNLADNIQTMPTVVFGISLATAIFPTLAEHINNKKIAEFASHINKSILSISYILIPLSILIIILREPLVRIILGSGFFGWEQTIETYNTLGCFAISLFAQGLIPVLARAFYAMHDTKTPTIISIVSVIIGIICAYILSPIYDVQGLALSFSIASIFNAVVLYIYLRRKIIEVKNYEKKLLTQIGKITLAAMISGVIVFALNKYIFSTSILFDLTRFWGVLLEFIFASIIGLLTYYFIAQKMQVNEVEVITLLLKKIISKNVPTK